MIDLRKSNPNVTVILKRFDVNTDIMEGGEVRDAICLLGASKITKQQRVLLNIIDRWSSQIWEQMCNQQFPIGINAQTVMVNTPHYIDLRKPSKN